MATDMIFDTRAGQAPRISVNKLGEYMTATPLRRRRIILDQQRPRAFIVPRYTEAQDAIVKYLVGDQRDESILLGEIERLNLAPSATAWEEQRKRLCSEALARFVEMTDKINLTGLAVARGGNDQQRLVVDGVEISVRPEVIVQGVNRHGEPVTGALKLYFSKTIPLNEDAGEYVATVLYQYLDQQTGPGNAEPKLCQVVDVFGGRVFAAPRATARRRRDVIAACEEIRRAWGAAGFRPSASR
jgi:hypothetical protein